MDVVEKALLELVEQMLKESLRDEMVPALLHVIAQKHGCIVPESCRAAARLLIALAAEGE